MFFQPQFVRYSQTAIDVRALTAFENAQGKGQRHTDCLDDVKINFVLHGLVPGERLSAYTMLRPQVRYDTNAALDLEQGSIGQRRTNFLWNGPTGNFEELYHWEKCLRACLEDSMSETMVSEFRKAAKGEVGKRGTLEHCC